ncbi:hypothetical protein XM79_c20326 [Vibrio vulnificus]|uniref:hypothetical protein n=1 Tax=Vibrio vulnificus TaxID=672 RepID=UPI0009B69698|nr:hypothetical protein [Vibrio vulnificus]EID4382612.1 hypothetical protein [Vibrio parahaemolyticus]MBE3981455.1 hypothetical protein [Vibrio parahaemolyticus]OQK60625.1 hypothetical protein XM78_c20326 [Vibrio vulnificus]OQK63334.1 hypothetical protein XM79_c20326 [Vibrio vulnificus]HCE3742143.1 hypothetical protein [Vibrio parahaemolyticus]
MNEDSKKIIMISTQDDVDDLINRVEKKILFAYSFKFEDRRYFLRFLECLNVKYEHFTEKYFYFDNSRNLHISESEFGYVWISTYGLISKDKSTENNLVNACLNQYTVLSLLIDKAIEVADSENVYDVDGYNFGYLSNLTPALFHNILFYIEVFGKAYLKLSGTKVPHTHELSKVYSLVKKTMFDKKHNDSLFHALIVAEFEKIIEYVASIPGDFKEHFVKYDDNSDDNTVIIFNIDNIRNIRETMGKCNDFISSYYYDGEKTSDLKSGLFERLISKSKNEKEKQRVVTTYSHLVAKVSE